MERVLRSILKFLYGIIAIAVILTVAILLYAQFGPGKQKLKPEDIEASQELNQTPSGENVNTENSTEVKPEDETTDRNTSGDISNLTGDVPQEPQPWTTAYNELLDTYDLRENCLTYYKDMNITGEDYHTFRVWDDGEAWESLLVYNKDSKEVHFYTPDGYLQKVYKNDFAGIKVYVEPTKDADGKSWRDVMEEYVTAVFSQADENKANGLVDLGYYYESEIYKPNNKGKRSAEAFLLLQERIIAISAQNLKDAKGEGLTDYAIIPTVTDIRESSDETGAPIVDCLIELTATYKVNGIQESEYADQMRLTLRKYSVGWRVIWMGEP